MLRTEQLIKSLQGYYKTNTEPTKVEWSCSEEQGVLNGDDEHNSTWHWPS